MKWGRLEIWGSAAKVFLMRAPSGTGWRVRGTIPTGKKPREGAASRFLMDARYAHNELLEALAAFGLVGFIFLAAWLSGYGPGKITVGVKPRFWVWARPPLPTFASIRG